MKLIAFYLPQYHRTPENDKWWGEGFTEWTNVRKAKPLFSGHYQPREPLGDNYYYILDPKVQKWQVETAKKYGIYGFCYYHFWFKGKQLLEKPLNQILKLGKPDFPFCLSWANESWTLAWYGKKNVLIMKQDYGNKDDWEIHFKYLLKVFTDKRYITVDGKPMFIIYRSYSIPDCDKMLEYWNERAIESGLKGIYFVETLSGIQRKSFCKNSKALVEFEPGYTFYSSDTPRQYTIKRKFRRLLKKMFPNKNYFLEMVDYDYFWSLILKRKNNICDKQIFPGGFIDWDNSPRRGNMGTIFKGASPVKFEKYLIRQIKRVKELYDSEFIFLNAWNEWGEGAYLEPDKKYGYGYLEAVRNALKENY